MTKKLYLIIFIAVVILYSMKDYGKVEEVREMSKEKLSYSEASTLFTNYDYSKDYYRYSVVMLRKKRKLLYGLYEIDTLHVGKVKYSSKEGDIK